MSSRWQKGVTPYVDWLKNLTPEEYDAHLFKRAQRKARKKAMEEVIDEQRALWLAELNNAAALQLKKALTTGDTQAFIAVWDRIIGKPKDEVVLEDNAQPQPWNDDFSE
jgi:type III secretory pathway component EscR